MAEPNATSETPAPKAGNGPTARKPETEQRSFAGEALRATLGDAGPAGHAIAAPAATGVTAHEFGDVWREAFAPLLSAQMEANRWFDQLWRQATGAGALPTLRTARPFGAFGVPPALGLPAADLRETDKAYQLSVELPGMTREDIDLKIERDTIRLCGQKAEDREDVQAGYRISERRFGRFERIFPIPEDVRREGIDASYADGVLKLVLPKTDQAQAQTARIPIR